jgi:hypothetical protein
MPTFVYAPGVRIYIEREKSNGTTQILDVSDDITEGTMVRRSDGVSTFNFSLQNANRKYDQVFAPNDRIVVMMKRITWVRVFTGYLNSVPLLSAWPSVVNFSASCSLKRLQYWFWDSYAPYTQSMIRLALAAGAGTRGDGGATNVVLSILDKVVGWPANKVHISKIPETWLEYALEIAEEVQAESDKDAPEELASVLGDGSGTTGGSITNVAPGNYGGYNVSLAQLDAAKGAYLEITRQGLTQDDAAFAIYVAMAETNLNTYQASPRGYGIYSQELTQPPPASLIAKLQDPAYATREFIERYRERCPIRWESREKLAWLPRAQAVQRFSKTGQYDNPVIAQGAAAIAKAFQMAGQQAPGSTTSGAQGGSPATPGASPGAAPSSTGRASAERFFRIGYDLVTNNSIPYKHPEDTGYSRSELIRQNPPVGLDCSSLVQWVYFNTTGRNDIPGVAQPQYNAFRKVSVQEAKNTLGALLFVINRGGSSADHVGISLGDGTGRAVQARRPGVPAGIVSDDWTHGALVPGIDYSGTVSAGGVIPSGSIDDGFGTPDSTGRGAPYVFNSSDPFNELFGSIWYPEQSQSGQIASAQALVGIRSLMNDQPLLPYLRDLMQSTMRSICSAPNGDFIAWFPDYYGIWGTAAKFTVEPIEVMDFNVTWTDDFFVTHQYTLAGQYNKLDIATGQVLTYNATADGPDIRTTTIGIATIEIPSIMKALFDIDADEAFAKKILTRFGARPDFQMIDGIVGKKGEFFSALYMFMRQWVYQYNADIPMTFMPEVWPGMIIQVPFFDFQAYVVTVTHSFKFGQGGGFQTLVNIAAPARMPKKKGDRTNTLIGLPDFGGIRKTKTAQEDIGQEINSWGPVPDGYATPSGAFFGDESDAPTSGGVDPRLPRRAER